MNQGPQPWDPHASSVFWTENPNAQGVRPPNPAFQSDTLPPYIKAQTWVAAPTKEGVYPNTLLQSRREPYAVEWVKNPYGALESRLGTNLGS